MEQKREYGFYYVRMFKGDEWTIGQYKGDFMRDGEEIDGWLLIAEEPRWDTSELYEIGERIPDNEELKKLLNIQAMLELAEKQELVKKLLS